MDTQTMKVRTVIVAVALVLVVVFAKSSNGQPSAACLRIFEQTCKTTDSAVGLQSCCSTFSSLYFGNMPCLCQIMHLKYNYTQSTAVQLLRNCSIPVNRLLPCPGVKAPSCFSTFMEGCEDTSTSAAQRKCCRTIVKLSKSNRACLCELFGLFNLTNRDANVLINCGGNRVSPGFKTCPSLPAGMVVNNDMWMNFVHGDI